jgi:hypothetical protein
MLLARPDAEETSVAIELAEDAARERAQDVDALLQLRDGVETDAIRSVRRADVAFAPPMIDPRISRVHRGAER